MSPGIQITEDIPISASKAAINRKPHSSNFPLSFSYLLILPIFLTSIRFNIQHGYIYGIIIGGMFLCDNFLPELIFSKNHAKSNTINISFAFYSLSSLVCMVIYTIWTYLSPIAGIDSWPILIISFYFLNKTSSLENNFLSLLLVEISFCFLYFALPIINNVDQNLLFQISTNTIWLGIGIFIIGNNSSIQKKIENKYDVLLEFYKWSNNLEASIENLSPRLLEITKITGFDVITVLRIRNDELTNVNSISQSRHIKIAEVVSEVYFGNYPGNNETMHWEINKTILNNIYNKKEPVLVNNFPGRESQDFLLHADNSPLLPEIKNQVILPIHSGGLKNINGFILFSRKKQISQSEFNSLIPILSSIGTALFPLLENDKYANITQSLGTLKEKINETVSEKELFSIVSYFLLKSLDIDAISYCKLGWGSGYPLDDISHVGLSTNIKVSELNTCLLQSANYYCSVWKMKNIQKFFSAFDDDSHLNEDHYGNESQHTFFFPIGTRENRLSALYLYSSQPIFLSNFLDLFFNNLNNILTKKIQELNRGKKIYQLNNFTKVQPADISNIALNVFEEQKPLLNNNGNALYTHPPQDIIETSRNKKCFLQYSELQDYLYQYSVQELPLNFDLGYKYKLLEGVFGEMNNQYKFLLSFSDNSLPIPDLLKQTIVAFTIYSLTAYLKINPNGRRIRILCNVQLNGVYISLQTDTEKNIEISEYKKLLTGQLANLNKHLGSSYSWKDNSVGFDLFIPLLPIVEGISPYGNN